MKKTNDESIDLDNNKPRLHASHGGCGRVQPKYTRVGVKISATFKEEESGTHTEVYTPDTVCFSFFIFLCIVSVLTYLIGPQNL